MKRWAEFSGQDGVHLAAEQRTEAQTGWADGNLD